MDKTEFLLALGEGLSGLPYAEQDKWMDFYNEAIDDRMEEGMTEEEAVASLGPVEDVIAQILQQSQPVKKEKKKQKLESWQLVLLIAGSPIWFSLLVAAASVVFSLLVVAWAVIISFYAVAVSLMVSGVALALVPPILIPLGSIGVGNFTLAPGVLCLGVGLLCAGLGIFWFIGTHYMTKGVIWLCKKLFSAVFVRKEAAA